MSAFFQPGNYFEAGISVLDPDVAGKEVDLVPHVVILAIWRMTTTSQVLH